MGCMGVLVRPVITMVLVAVPGTGSVYMLMSMGVVMFVTVRMGVLMAVSFVSMFVFMRVIMNMLVNMLMLVLVSSFHLRSFLSCRFRHHESP